MLQHQPGAKKKIYEQIKSSTNPTHELNRDEQSRQPRHERNHTPRRRSNGTIPRSENQHQIQSHNEGRTSKGKSKLVGKH